jgi:hypothetical protein
MQLSVPVDAPRGVVDLAARQAGAALRPQLVDAGLSRSKIDAQLDARRWLAYGPRVVVMHNGPLTQDQQRWAAVLNAGRGAALAGLTAAEVGGLTGWSDEAVHVLVRRGSTPPELPGVVVRKHESRRYSPTRDLAPNRFPPRVRLERAVVDAAAWTRPPRLACGLVVAAAQQRLTTATRLRNELSDAGLVRHRRILRAVMDDLEGGAEALSEIDFGAFCRRYRLPTPVRQVVRVDRYGRRRYLDAVLRRADGAAVAVEIDGAVHLIARTYWNDCSRANELVIAGERMLRFPTVALYLEPDVVADQLRRMLQR